MWNKLFWAGFFKQNFTSTQAASVNVAVRHPSSAWARGYSLAAYRESPVQNHTAERKPNPNTQEGWVQLKMLRRLLLEFRSFFFGLLNDILYYENCDFLMRGTHVVSTLSPVFFLKVMCLPDRIC
jgi:hypothetical protein